MNTKDYVCQFLYLIQDCSSCLGEIHGSTTMTTTVDHILKPWISYCIWYYEIHRQEKHNKISIVLYILFWRKSNSKFIYCVCTFSGYLLILIIHRTNLGIVRYFCLHQYHSFYFKAKSGWVDHRSRCCLSIDKKCCEHMRCCLMMNK